MFKDGDLVVEVNSGLIYRFLSYNKFKISNKVDCSVYENEDCYIKKVKYGSYKCSIDFWFYNKRHILVEKTRKIKTMK